MEATRFGGERGVSTPRSLSNLALTTANPREPIFFGVKRGMGMTPVNPGGPLFLPGLTQLLKQEPFLVVYLFRQFYIYGHKQIAPFLCFV